MGESTTGHCYILILKDDASSFIWLEPCLTADAQTTVDVLTRWFSSIGVVLTWNSDRGSHFKNTVMTALNRALHAHHNFTTAYCPQSNGTVETVCKEVLRAARALLSEFRMKEKEWPAVVRIIQSVLNHSKRPSLGNRAPVTVFTGLPADNPLRTILPPDTATAKTIDQIKLLRNMHIESTMKALKSMHRDVAATPTRKRKEAVDRHNRKTHVKKVNFDKGDFVLIARQQGKTGNKLRVNWRGPFQITRVQSEFIFECKEFINKKHSLVHANRLKFYADSKLNVTEELLDTIEHNAPHYNTINRLLDLRRNPITGDFEVKAEWKGFDYEEPDWEPFDILQEDVPEMLEEFLQTFPEKDLVAAARWSLRILFEGGMLHAITTHAHM